MEPARLPSGTTIRRGELMSKFNWSMILISLITAAYLLAGLLLVRAFAPAGGQLWWAIGVLVSAFVLAAIAGHFTGNRTER